MNFILLLTWTLLPKDPISVGFKNNSVPSEYPVYRRYIIYPINLWISLNIRDSDTMVRL